jgi:transposase
MKHNRNMRGLLLRGKLKAGGEFLLMCIVHNLRKIAGYLKGGRIAPQPLGA